MKHRRSPAPFLVGFICFIVIGVLFAGVYWWQEQRLVNAEQDTRTIVTLQDSLSQKEGEVGDLQKRLSSLEGNLVSSTQQGQDILKETEEIKKRSDQLSFQLTQLREIDDSEELPRVYIEQNTVFYSDEDGQRTVLAEAELYDEINLRGIQYISAELSPREDFVVIWYKVDTVSRVEIFEVASRESIMLSLNEKNIKWSEISEWGSNGFLEFSGCGVEGCGTFISKTRQEPWIVEFVPDEVENTVSSTE